MSCASSSFDSRRCRSNQPSFVIHRRHVDRDLRRDAAAELPEAADF
ncbi:MAG: hypothetical protein WD009_04925 [Phycisphaeraceae bacterium]